MIHLGKFLCFPIEPEGVTGRHLVVQTAFSLSVGRSRVFKPVVSRGEPER
jgi:hypothetical protein